ncbi:UDP-phosphate galactose phosphotransferase [Lysobacter daejeonensis GH1-9]|uniref:UDP-phosphate galactose phosphotransferase n=1 Tax=Lysobacter daejeonensis GH1-9 TaxID=1385517 RepID=A0A0A0ETT0_9GAMM|nr:undecaprenyl-phosphate glucose phosphotransferase [Lysobacter daejeonensis]KGM54321.1 UDP-phosphate galactose phosphotransferase [Lysobacter daejeonensis GH1-9]
MHKFAAMATLGLRVGDAVVLVAAACLAYWLRFDTYWLPMEYQSTVARAVIVMLLVFGSANIYRSWRGQSLTLELTRMTALWGVVFGLSLLYVLMFKLEGATSRLWWGSWFVAVVLTTGGARILARGLAAWVRAQGWDLRSAVVIGANADATRIVQTFQGSPWAGIDVRGWFNTCADTRQLTGVRHLGDLDALADYVESHHIDQVWVALPMSAQAEIQAILARLDHATADIKFVPDLFGLQLLNHSVDQVAGLPVINLRASPLDGHARAIKAIEDRVLAALILILIAPLLAILALGVKLSSPGPVLFRQQRHGLGGKIIEVWKFRSMRLHAEDDGKVTQAKRGDPRVTRFGGFLRQTSLDELPQFFNVLQGTMSIVGPRPHAVAHNHQYKNEVQHYMQRHRVKPGITGWAQVNGLRGETDTVAKMAARVEYDLYYLQNWSVLLDLRIIALTIVKGFMGKAVY